MHAANGLNKSEIAGIVTDEHGPSSSITEAIKSAVDSVLWNMEHKFHYHETFIPLAGHKIFRDFIWNYQHIFYGDHKYFKEHGYYDWPKKSRLKFTFLNWIFSSEKRLTWMGKWRQK